MSKCQYLKRCLKPSLAFHQSIAKKLPGVVFLPGFLSNMDGRKARMLEEWCRSSDRPFIRFDYSGVGLSEGNLTHLRTWVDDATDVITSLTSSPQILVGSSMGAYVMLQFSQAHPDRVAGMLGVAPAFGIINKFRSWSKSIPSVNGFRLIRTRYAQAQIPDSFFSPEILNELDRVMGEIKLTCPLHILQGRKDDVVDSQFVLNFVDSLSESVHDVTVTLQKNGDHRLSRQQDLDLLVHIVKFMSDHLSDGLSLQQNLQSLNED